MGLLHIDHLEDLVFDTGWSGLADSLIYLETCFNIICCSHTDIIRRQYPDINITTKYDGSVSIVFGKHSDTNKFFIGTKSVFNAVPKINYTLEDIEKNHGHAPGLVEKLQLAFVLLKDQTFTKIYQADIVFCDDLIVMPSHYEFTPNTITYKIHRDHPCAINLMNKRLGLVVHTEYDSLDECPRFTVDQTAFKNTADILYIDPNIDFPVRPPNMAKLWPELKYHIDYLDELYNFNFDTITKYAAHFRTYVNACVRLDTEPTYVGLLMHYGQKHATAILKLKTNAARDKQEAKFTQTFSDFDDKELISEVFKYHALIRKFKDILVNTLSQNTLFEHYIDNKKVKPEGFVLSTPYAAVKLVDRAEFSKMNFARFS